MDSGSALLVPVAAQVAALAVPGSAWDRLEPVQECTGEDRVAVALLVQVPECTAMGTGEVAAHVVLDRIQERVQL